MLFKRSVFCLILLLLTISIPVQTLTAQPEENITGMPYIRNYTYSDYKGGRSVWAITQDLRGVMYFGHEYGILEFDGKTWRNIEITNNSSLRWLATDSTGKIFVGAQNELGYLDQGPKGQMTYYSLRNQLPKHVLDFTDVWELRATSNAIYFRSFSYIFRWKDGKFTTWSLPKNGTRFDVISVANDKPLFRIAGLGYYTIEGDDLTFLKGTEYLADIKSNGVIELDKNNWLIFTRIKGIYKYNGVKLTRLITPHEKEYESINIYEVYKINNEQIAMATLFDGLWIINTEGKRLYRFNRKNGLMDNYAINTATDRNGNLWVGLNHGISRIHIQSAFSYYAENLTQITGNIFNIVKDKGDIYFLTAEGVLRLNQKKQKGKFFERIMNDIAYFRDYLFYDDILFFGSNVGIYSFKNNQMKWANESRVREFHQSLKDPSIIFSAGWTEGFFLMSRKGDDLVTLGSVPSLFPMQISQMLEEDHRIWFATEYSGVILATYHPDTLKNTFQFETFKEFKATNGLPSDSKNIIIKFNNSIILGSEKGLYVFDEIKQEFIPLTELNQYLPTNNPPIRLLSVDQNNRLWIQYESSKQYITITTTQVGNTFTKPKEISFINSKDQLFTGIMHDENNIHWFGSDNQLMQFNENLSEKYVISSNLHVLIRSLTLNSDSLLYGGFGVTQMPVIEFGNNSYKINYAAVNFNESDDILYQYKLENQNKQEWSNWTSETSKEYTNLPEGLYKFYVRAQSKSGNLGDVTLYEFRILPPWYRKWWAILFYMIGFVVIIFAIISLRTQALRRDKEVLEIKVKEKSLQLVQAEKLAAIGQLTSGLAHEINNPLTILKLNLEVLETQLNNKSVGGDETSSTFEKYLNHCYDALSRIASVIEKMKSFSQSGIGKNIIVDINKQLLLIIDMFQNQYPDIQIEKYFEKLTGLNASPDRLNLAFYNILHNAMDAVTINISPRKPTISIQTKQVNDTIEISISDNGTGIPKDVLTKVFDPFFSTKIVGKGKGLGLTESYAIITSLGGDIKITSNSEGTMVVVFLPIVKQ